MGAGLAGRLVEHGLEVRTLLGGRSDASRRRAGAFEGIARLAAPGGASEIAALRGFFAAEG
ncbi:hypothetical protein SAMN06265365_11331 [Tistlia consotensis]|uniref:Uncharacterized protein n=2 Tax=Tistlia TaxID=1321364 RepID=A0A1Y6C2E9_9PROT|nr:hypothetical protein SAMN05428998_114114 [Tistlia consotensis USBA 355]SNR73507.1 hypothetical protein SAMN06265365_11331 [Tistlia consotensis]